MTAYLLFHVHDSGVHPMTFKHADFWCSLFRVHPVIINTGDGRIPSERCPVLRFASLAEAMRSAELGPLTWVWLDHHAELYIDEYNHPADGVVYCLGDDYSGWGDVEPTGDLVRARGLGEVHSSLIVPLLCYDRHVCVATGGR